MCETMFVMEQKHLRKVGSKNKHDAYFLALGQQKGNQKNDANSYRPEAKYYLEWHNYDFKVAYEEYKADLNREA